LSGSNTVSCDREELQTPAVCASWPWSSVAAVFARRFRSSESSPEIFLTRLLIMLGPLLGWGRLAWIYASRPSNGITINIGDNVFVIEWLMQEKAGVFGRFRRYYGPPAARSLGTRWSLILCVFAMVASAPLSFAAETPAPKTVLILHSFTDRRAQDDLEILKASTRSHVGTPVDFHVEFLGSARFDTPGYEKAVTESLASVYRGKKIDLVIAVFYPALQFAVDHRQELFPGTPIAFSSVPPKRLEGQKLWPGVTGVTMDVDLQGTINLAFRLQPDASNAAVVVGSSQTDRYWGPVIEQDLRQRQTKLNVINLSGLATDQLLKQISALPPRTIVFFQSLPDEEAQPAIGTSAIVSTIARKFPTYCFINLCLGHGVVGGSYPDSLEQETDAGELAARILLGEAPENIPVVPGPTALVHVDWRQLGYWNIPASALPPGTVISYRQPSGWQRYAKYIGLVVLLFLVQAMLIIGLLWQRARNRKADLRLRESEKRFRLMADTAPALIWMCDKEGKVTYFNDRLINFIGRDAAAGRGDAWSAFIHPDDVQSVQAANKRALVQQHEFSKEYRLRRLDGLYRWMLDIAAPRVNGDGAFTGFVGSAADITDQKLAQEALEKIGGKLIEAQEEERGRIARELHDDICQRLALLSMELEQANRGTNGSGASAKIEEIRTHCAQIAVDVQALSHKLHSSKLEYLGLAAAIRSFCREFSQQYNVGVQFDDEDVPSYLPYDISLSLFRVTQEALQNAQKYSGVDHFFVSLRGSTNEVRLEVSDSGSGFDIEKAKFDRGLGLVSMQERVHLVHGTFAIESMANSGTKIIASVPLVPEMKASVAENTGA
jgi:PAS domain S-box-containing protein